jgi:hypothetical protein
MRRILLAPPLLVVIVLFGFGGCLDQGHQITYVNETDRTIVGYLGDGLDDRDWVLGPGETVKLGTLKSVWDDVIVFRDEQKNVLGRLELTWDELKNQDYRVVVREEDLVSSAE